MSHPNDTINLVFTSPDWMADAPCKGLTDLFYVDPTQPGTADTAAQAKAICRTCPHREPCLDLALQNNDRAGIWGGLAPKQRRIVARDRETGSNRRQARHGTDAGIRQHERNDEPLCRACQWHWDDTHRTSPFETTRERRARLRRERAS